MSDKIAFNGSVVNYNFPLAGRRVLVAPVNTAKPATLVPIYDDSMPAAPVGWTDLGIPVDALVDVSVDYTTAQIVTGTLQNIRKTYIDKQTGKISTKIYNWEPAKIATISGQGSVITTASTSLNRAIKSLGIGGTLGNKLAVLVFQDFGDNNLTEDGAGGASYEQFWIYTPGAQRNASVNLAEFQTKTNIMTFDYELLPYSNSVYPGRSIMCEAVWIGV